MEKTKNGTVNCIKCDWRHHYATEANLTALIEDMDTTTTQPTTVTTEPEPEPTTEQEPEAEGKNSNIGGILLIVLVLGAGGGAFYYFKILKPKQATQGGTDLTELDELDFDDDEFMNMGADEPEQEDETE